MTNLTQKWNKEFAASLARWRYQHAVNPEFFAGKTPEQVAVERMQERVSSYIRSFSLRRDFDESLDAYLARNPTERAQYEEACQYQIPSVTEAA